MLVVGSSGAGKDTLLTAAAKYLASEKTILFARRSITRECDPQLEVHHTLTVDAFHRAVCAGNYAFQWQAHGLGYLIGKSIEQDIRAGNTIVLNVSRSVVGEAIRRYENVCVIEIHVPNNVLAKRLSARGRENAEEIEARLNRAPFEFPPDAHVCRVENTSTVEEGGHLLAKVIGQAAGLVGEAESNRP